jgi:hypothetical protein
MTADQAITQRGGGYHVLIIQDVLAILLGLVLCLPAPSRAADVPADMVPQGNLLRIGALPPPMVTGKRPVLFADKSGIRLQEDLERPDQDDTTEAIVLTPDEYRRLKQPGRSLTDDEYKEFKNLTTISKATPLQVAAVNLAIKATGVFVIGLAWLLFLHVLRRSWNFWFDKDLWGQTWPSVVVVTVLLICTAWILVSVVS